MPTTEGSGTTAALTVGGAATTLLTAASLKTRVLTLDMVNSAQGDIFEVLISSPCLAGAANRILWQANPAHAQDHPLYQSPPVVMQAGGTFTIQQTAGTARTVPWRVDTLD